MSSIAGVHTPKEPPDSLADAAVRPPRCTGGVPYGSESNRAHNARGNAYVGPGGPTFPVFVRRKSTISGRISCVRAGTTMSVYTPSPEAEFDSVTRTSFPSGLEMKISLRKAVGTQWELRRALPCTDQRLGHRDAPVVAYIDRRVCPGGPPLRLLFGPTLEAAASDGRIGLDRGKLLIPRRLERDGSRGAARPPGPGSPGPPRAETSTPL